MILGVKCMEKNTLDITPTPRILRTLGEIPFQPWQCIAELIDNSVDAFAEAERANMQIDEKKISVTWSGDVATPDRTIEILDTGPGMGIEQIQNAVRAGYTSNDPVSNLGLFGMGFNIATARLGENTKLLSSKINNNEWVGVEIDFTDLINSKSFSAKVIKEKKKSKNEHGTKIIVSKLRGETYCQLRDHETQIRRQLENIYAPLLDQISVEIYIQNKKLSPKRHCVWGKTRYVTRNGKKINAVIDIDRDLGNALFDIERNTYLSRDEEDGLKEEIKKNGNFPANIIERRKRLKGWIGIQRFSDPNDFGIDFVRNGRKILIGNKQLFSYENPMTGTSTLEYPVELGSTVGGRIVGELHVDYLLPTYQKNDFDKTDMSWNETVEAVRGVGPILPNLRKAMGYNDANISPLGILASAYRRPEQGTKCLFVDRNIAKEFYECFKKNEPGYIADDKWWEAAQEADRLRATSGASAAPVVDEGDTPSDDPDAYGPTDAGSVITKPTDANKDNKTTVDTDNFKKQITSKLDDLIKASKNLESWSGPYTYGSAPPLNIKVWELTSGTLMLKGESVPCMFFADGVDCDFLFNPRHQILSQFPINPRLMLSIYLAEKFKARDALADIGLVFGNILQHKMQDFRIDKAGLQEKAAVVFDKLREKMLESLKSKKKDVLKCIHESSGDVEETVTTMLSNGGLIIPFQSMNDEGFSALQYVPYRTILRLVDNFPGDLFDGKVFIAPYNNLQLTDSQATERARNESKDRIISFLKDALWVISQTGSNSIMNRAKDELIRCSHSISFLTQEIAE